LFIPVFKPVSLAVQMHLHTGAIVSDCPPPVGFGISLKQERICLKPPNGGIEWYQMVKEYIRFYHEKRRHAEMGKMPPDQKYCQRKTALKQFMITFELC
jgi:hypothetical protein